MINPKPKVVYDNSADSTSTQIIVDTTAITAAGLPIHFDSANFLIYPIGQYRPEKRGSKIYMSSYSSGSSGLDTSNFVTLTENQIGIRSFIISEDIDKNGEFDKSDQLHYYYADLMNDNKIAIEYNPIAKQKNVW